MTFCWHSLYFSRDQEEEDRRSIQKACAPDIANSGLQYTGKEGFFSSFEFWKNKLGLKVCVTW